LPTFLLAAVVMAAGVATMRFWPGADRRLQERATRLSDPPPVASHLISVDPTW